MPTTLRPWIGYALAAYLVAVFPGNIYVAVAGVDVEGLPGGAYHGFASPSSRVVGQFESVKLTHYLQPLLIWLAIWTTRVIDPSPTESSAVRARVAHGAGHE